VNTRTATRAQPAAFDVCGPLPTGTTVLEASAGTGKTFTIAALAARYLAEGRAELSELMLVTFGREATNELRERVRERLVSTERGLADPATARSGPDEVLALLAGAGDEEVALRRARLTRAVTQFDAATIATTHQFCQRMLAGLGVAADADPDARFVESVDDLLTEVVDDFYVRKYADHGTGSPAFSRAEALTIARHAVNDHQARLEPTDADAGSTADARRRFAAAVRAEVDRRKQARRLYTYDDMLTRLDAALADPERGAAQRLQDRYRVVLVDEFQDTDPVQWSILRRAFHGAVTLVLIGDPKQAIYAFRGADVTSYLDATEAAGRHATLARNWRSDPALLSALNTVLGGSALGDPRITVHPVQAAHRGRRLRGGRADSPLRIRVVPGGTLPRSQRDQTVVGPTRELVAQDLAGDVAALLTGPALIQERPVRPGDVAVLVRTNDQGTLVRDALAAVGVPAVLSGTVSVFTTPVAEEWLTLLEACAQPRLPRLRAAALTCFVGHSIADLCGPGGTELLDELGGTVREWAAVLAERGVAALLEAVTTGTALPRRLLSRPDGERTLTDLRHVAQALHAAASAGHLGPAALLEWLRHRIDEAALDVGVERSRRLESDAAAVQIITIHRSKGLEFPIVYVPFGWDRNVRDPDVPLLHDEHGRRVLDVGGETGEGWKERCAQHRAEEAGEDLRLLYVALTRAQCQVVLWWAPATTAATSPVHRLLLGRAPGVGGAGVAASVVAGMSVFEPAERYRVPTDTAAVVALRAWAGPEIAVEPAGPAVSVAPADPGGVQDRVPLRAARFARELDTRWRRTSYSALTAGAGAHGAGAHGFGVGSEPEDTGTDDELEIVAAEPEVPAAGPPSPLAAFPLGAAFGTLVHAVLEVADLTAPDLPAELATHCAEQLGRGPVPGVDPDALAAALLPVAHTPLGPLTGGRRLADIAPADRLAELDFELPLAGGDGRDADGADCTNAGRTSFDQAGDSRPGPQLSLGDLAPLLRRHLAPDDPLAGYPSALTAPGLADQPLRGYLTGSVDAVLRLPGPRFAIVDYKTNWLGPLGGPDPLTAAHYTAPRLAEAMIAANYPLQALLYGVALHRYLRWRVPGYDPRRHLGGVLYLFVRGMCGPDTPAVDGVPCGVFSWTPPPALTVELSQLLDRGTA